MARELSISLRDLYLRYPCTCAESFKIRDLKDPTCAGCDLRAEFGPETVEPPPRPPFETFKRPTCKGCLLLGNACGHCEKCVWYKAQQEGTVWGATHMKEG